MWCWEKFQDWKFILKQKCEKENNWIFQCSHFSQLVRQPSMKIQLLCLMLDIVTPQKDCILNSEYVCVSREVTFSPQTVSELFSTECLDEHSNMGLFYQTWRRGGGGEAAHDGVGFGHTELLSYRHTDHVVNPTWLIMEEEEGEGGATLVILLWDGCIRKKHSFSLSNDRAPSSARWTFW